MSQQESMQEMLQGNDKKITENMNRCLEDKRKLEEVLGDEIRKNRELKEALEEKKETCRRQLLLLDRKCASEERKRVKHEEEIREIKKKWMSEVEALTSDSRNHTPSPASGGGEGFQSDVPPSNLMRSGEHVDYSKVQDYQPHRGVLDHTERATSPRIRDRILRLVA